MISRAAHHAKIRGRTIRKQRGSERTGRPRATYCAAPAASRAGAEKARAAWRTSMNGQARQKKFPAKQDQHQHAAKVKPAQCGRQILRRQRGSEQTVQNHHQADNKEEILEGGGRGASARIVQSRDFQQIKKMRIQDRPGPGWGRMQQHT